MGKNCTRERGAPTSSAKRARQKIVRFLQGYCDVHFYSVVAQFQSEVEAWTELGHHVLRGADATWTRERVLLYFSRFYLSNRGHPPVVVVGLSPCDEMARMSGAEAVRRRYRG